LVDSTFNYLFNKWHYGPKKRLHEFIAQVFPAECHDAFAFLRSHGRVSSKRWCCSPRSNVLFTDGAKYVADQAGACWLRDEIALAQRYGEGVAAELFQSWKLKVNPDHSANLVCEDGNGTVVYQKAIEYTDFPLPEIALYFTDNTILLPSEY